ncbi:hypothetical protein [Colwellia piezophila]|uniref:hypothetical protein n=1 Tax=Colwellia piezophila TaxID=211668 RepID=UPI00036B3185|nr:hypothetical protein [Colwellia piezophila]
MKKTISAFNTEYPTYTALAAYFGQDRELVYNRIKTYGWSPEKAVLTDKHGSIRKSYSDHALLLKSPLLFKIINKARESVERIKRFKKEIVKQCSKRIKTAKKAFIALTIDNVVTKGHGRYSLGRFKAKPDLAKSIGCLYLAKIPLGNNSFYLKIGISKYLNPSERKKSLPKGTEILDSQHAELHRCFQAEQIMLKEFKQKGLVIPKHDRFEGYSEVLTLIPAKSSINNQYVLGLRSSLKETKPYNKFIKD